MRDHRKLKAFEFAEELVTAVYRATRAFPREEVFGLTSQMRRAAVSVAANIVEGCARRTLKEYVNFLNVSFGSLREVGYYIELSHRLSYLSEQEMQELKNLYDQTARVLSGLMKSLRTRISS
jgi:four helix bundle protein